MHVLAPIWITKQVAAHDCSPSSDVWITGQTDPEEWLFDHRGLCFNNWNNAPLSRQVCRQFNTYIKAVWNVIVKQHYICSRTIWTEIW
jgi:hypothetical protein